MNKSCPPSFQPYKQICPPQESTQIYSGLNLTYLVDNLLPYTAYEFQLKVFNEIGSADSPTWVKAETQEKGW